MSVIPELKLAQGVQNKDWRPILMVVRVQDPNIAQRGAREEAQAKKHQDDYGPV